jgi:hypothetical protein
MQAMSPLDQIEAEVLLEKGTWKTRRLGEIQMEKTD